MKVYQFGIGEQLRVIYQPAACNLRIETSNGTFAFSDDHPFVEVAAFGRNFRLLLNSARQIHIEEFYSAIGEGIRAVYESFYVGNKKLSFSIDTLIWVEEHTGKCVFELEINDDDAGCVRKVHWPQPMEFDDGDPNAYTTIPMMQGTLIPSKWRNTVLLTDGRYYHHDGYMPWFGQRWGKQGYLMITRTASDAGYHLNHLPNTSTRISNVWYPSLGQMRYRRICELTFFGLCDYNDFCKAYRQYVFESGRFVTLREKVYRNPALRNRIGAPLIQDYILVSADPTSQRFYTGNPEWNRHYIPFSQRLSQLERLRSLGLKRAFVHLDGYGQFGYDSGHPDIFPPHDDVGGITGMQQLISKCHELGYSMDFHDQYRDFYHNSPSFCDHQSIHDAEGSQPSTSSCYGGNQTFLCARFALPYIRRNYRLLENNNLRPDGVHLASFSGSNLDECYHTSHLMTRSDCIQHRREAFGFLRSQGYITCSDEPVDCLIDAVDMVIHAPYSLTPVEWDGMGNGIPVPLLSLVYHDALIVPWFGNQRQNGGWGIPNSDSANTHAILNASPVGLEIDATEQEIHLADKYCMVAAELAHVPMVKHEFLRDDLRLQRTVFADGTVIEVDFDTNEAKVSH